MSKPHCTLLGAGLVGSLLSVYLSRRGYSVDVYERRPDMRASGAYGGRSINLALSDRGFAALERLGLSEEIRSVGIPMYGRMVHDEKGHTMFFSYGKEDQAIYSVSRAGLNFKLMDIAERNENVRMHFNMRAAEVDLKNRKVRLENDLDSSFKEIDYQWLVGSDGAFSALRSALLKTDRFEYSQDYLPHGYKELHIPPAEDGSFQMEKHALHIWPRGQFMLIALPNLDGSFTCTLFLPFEGKQSFESLQGDASIHQFFHDTFPDTLHLIPDLLGQFKRNPTSSLVTVRCYPWVWEDSACLIGDAAHAIVPFYGQGMNCGFEDCLVLDKMLDAFEDQLSKALPAYQDLRKPDGDAVGHLAKLNFVEMRDLVADPKFQLRKKIEAKIYQHYPDKWIPLYTMVTFSPEIRYSTAYNTGLRQDTIMEEILQLPDVENSWQDEQFFQVICQIVEKHNFGRA